MHALVVIYVGLLGLVIGSFLTVVIHRVPAGESIVSPRSRCPGCGSTIRARDNVPVVSYLVRRGRCRSCGEAISSRYLIVELLTGALFAGVALRVPTAWDIAPYCVLAATLVALGAIDLEWFRVPTRIILAGGTLGGALLVVASAGTRSWAALAHGAIAGAVALGLFLLLHLAVPRGMGRGDVRLAGLCGGFLGWLGYRDALVGIWLGFLFGGLFAIGLLLLGRVKRGAHLPFAPFLSAGTLGAVLLGSTLSHLALP